MRSRRNQGQCLSARNHQRNLYSRRLSPLHAERYGPPPCPVRGGEWMMGKFAATALALLSLTSLVLLILLGAQGFAQTAPAGQTPATPPAAQRPATPTPAAKPPDS